ncbi:NAD(P)/FAD-dependent oxidoreductase [Synechococcus sp. W4D4]|uniref:NAD(P)/FAD-dependent oxidoreductase n=1 Tax=Synechococcus sp. W4D4 TaxID=3392294 RepID=UPI0039EA15BE
MVGLSVAWELQRIGHQVTLFDPHLRQAQSEDAGSSAALGLLMARLFRRSSGRGWRLRQQSHTLWRQWRDELQQRGHVLPFRAGLLQLATTAAEQEAQVQLASQREDLRLLQPTELEQLRPLVPQPCLGGLLSPGDGQLDPIPAMQALLEDGERLGLTIEASAVSALERSSTGQWRVRNTLDSPGSFDWVVLSAGLSSSVLLEPLGHERPQHPVLGQALELQLAETDHGEGNWPGSLSWSGINLVPRPGGRLWLGATVEIDHLQGQPQELRALRELGGHAPPWLQRATVLRQWQGLRARPLGRPAPLLEQLEPGLLLASGHYRNGVLLAPATAAWAAEQIENAGQC